MADVATAPQQVQSGVQDTTPVATMGYGARESADAKRQATDSQMAHDEPEDINFNAIVARSQALTIDVLGKEFATNGDARQKMADSNLDWREIHKGKLFGSKPNA